MDEGLDAPGEAPAPAASRSRSPLGLVLFALVFALGGGIATLALTAALSFLGLGSALALGFFLAIGIPLFLALRVSGALKRRGTPALARHLLAALLGLLSHAALLGITYCQTPDVAAIAAIVAGRGGPATIAATTPPRISPPPTTMLIYS